MEEKNKSILISCIEQIKEKGDKITINISDDNVTFTFANKERIFGQQQMPYEEFKILLNSDLNTEAILSDWIGMAYNQVLEKKGSKTRLMV